MSALESVDRWVQSIIDNGGDGVVNPHGNAVFRGFTPSEKRYLVDFCEARRAEGWEQFDTDQDAWYFGVWVNAKRMRMLSYAEGDWTVVVCVSRAAYIKELVDMCSFYGEGFVCKTIGSEGITEYRQDRAEFLDVAQVGGAL